MKKFNALLLTTLAGLVFLASDQSAVAQQRPDGTGGGRGGRGNFNREDMMARMMERYQTALEMNDEEWGVVRPMVENVMAKQREVRGNRFGGFGGPGARGGRGGRPGDEQANQGGRGGRGGRGGDQAGDPTQEALQAALDSKTTSPADITAKLKAYRDARKTREGALAKARTELGQVLTARQTARMVLMGILE